MHKGKIIFLLFSFFLFVFLGAGNAYAYSEKNSFSEIKRAKVSVVITIPVNIVEKISAKKVVRFKVGSDLAKSINVTTPSGKVIVRDIKKKPN